MSKKSISPIMASWNEFRKERFTAEEIAEGDLKVAIINELVKARQEKGITQKELEAKSGINQAIISRIENGTVDPQITTVMKLLRPLGKKLAIVSLDETDL